MTLQAALINCPALVARLTAIAVVIAQKLLGSNPTTRVGIGKNLITIVQLKFHN